MLLVGLSPAYADTACVFDNRTDQRLNMPQANAETLLAMERYSPCPEATPKPASGQSTNLPPGYRTVTWRDTISLTGPDMECESTPQNAEMLFRCTMLGLPWGSAGNFEIYERTAVPERDYRRDLGTYLEGQAHLHVCLSGGRSEVDVADALVPMSIPTAHGTFIGWELHGIFPDCANYAPHMVAVRAVDIPLGDYGVFVVAVAAGWLADLEIIELDLDDDIVTLVDGISVAEPAS